tara:strand:+ start:671 stop:913 length:243 start_codon:yes stop_codon:yes gene_type:complete
MPNPNKNESQNDGKSSGAVFVYEDPKTGELFHFSRRGMHKKNGRVLVFVKRSKGGLTPQQRTDYIEAIKEHLGSDDETTV